MKTLKRRGFKPGMKKQQGFALIVDIGFWVSVAMAGSVYMSGMVAGEQENILAQRTVSDMSLILNAARTYKGHQTDGYTSCNLTKLTSTTHGYLNGRFGDGVGVNEWGGNYTCGAGASASDLTLSSTGMPTTVCNKIAGALGKDFDAACASGTITLKTI